MNTTAGGGKRLEKYLVPPRVCANIQCGHSKEWHLPFGNCQYKEEDDDVYYECNCGEFE